MHSSLIGKVEKANRYARELDRITIDRLSLTFRGDNDTHHIGLDAGQWRCTCHYFESWGSCVHLLTLQKVFGVMLPEDAQVSHLRSRGASLRLTPPSGAPRDGAGARCALRSSLTHLEVRSLRCSVAPSPAPSGGAILGYCMRCRRSRRPRRIS